MLALHPLGLPTVIYTTDTAPLPLNLCDIGLNRQIRVIQLIREIHQPVIDPIRACDVSYPREVANG